jgi:hypothetical protein
MSAHIIPGRVKVTKETRIYVAPVRAPQIAVDFETAELKVGVSTTVNSRPYVVGNNDWTRIFTFRTPKVINGLRAAFKAFRGMYGAQTQYETDRTNETRQVMANYHTELAEYRKSLETVDSTLNIRETSPSEIASKGLDNLFQ